MKYLKKAQKTIEEPGGTITKTKFDALQEFKIMIHNSWTWERLTPEQRKKFDDLLTWTRFKPVGTYYQAFSQLNNYYEMFLKGIETVKEDLLK